MAWNTYTFIRSNGDGHLLCPGPSRTIIPSHRFENIRDGVEDYELLHELKLTTDRLRAGGARRLRRTPR